MPHLGPKAFDAAVLALLRKQPPTGPDVLAHLRREHGENGFNYASHSRGTCSGEGPVNGGGHPGMGCVCVGAQCNQLSPSCQAA
jgi:hypothetical protein